MPLCTALHRAVGGGVRSKCCERNLLTPRVPFLSFAERNILIPVQSNSNPWSLFEERGSSERPVCDGVYPTQSDAPHLQENSFVEIIPRYRLC